MFLVPKKNGGYRPVLDISHLNTFIETAHFKMENLSTLKSLLNKGDYMINIDLTDAYLSVPIHQTSQRFLRFMWQGKSYQFTTMPFGLNVAPRIFTKLLKPVVAWLRGQGIRLVIYLDDLLIIASSKETLNRHKQLTIALLESLGFLINYEKSMLIPTQKIQFLGLLIDSVNMKFILPEAKTRSIQKECQQLLNTEFPTIRHLSRVLGLLTFCRPAIWSAPLHYRQLQELQIRSLKQWSNYDKRVPLTQPAKKDLLWWITNLPLLKGSRIIPPTADLTITSDASKSGWGATFGQLRTGGRWSQVEAQDHINILELKAAFFALKSFVKYQTNQVICLKLDNTTAVAYLNNLGGTHCSQLLRLTLEIWEWCEKKSVFLLAQHIPGKRNTAADIESRTSRDRNDWKLKASVILPMISHCQVDLFASRLSHQLDQYVSWRPDPKAIHTDAFAMNWSNIEAYAFPPFNLVHAVLHKTKTDMASIVLVAPLWSAQPWWPLLLELLIDYPVYLGNDPDLLEDVSNPGTIHPLFPSLRLAVWKISGNLSQQRAFQRQLPNSSPTVSRPQPPNPTTAHGLSGVVGVRNGKVIQYLVPSRKFWLFWLNYFPMAKNIEQSMYSDQRYRLLMSI